MMQMAQTTRKKKLTRHMNLPLVAGGLILALILIVMLFPTLFTANNPYAGNSLKDASITGGLYRISGAPFPPSKEFPFGSDMIGRDVFTLLIYGTRLTMTLGFLVIVGRFLIAVPLGIAAGFGNKLCKGILSQFSILFSAIPALVISFIVLNMNFFKSLYKNESILAFVIVLTVIGFGKLGQVIEERVTGIMARDFINGEKAIGKGRLRIAVENVLPHLAPELVILLFMEFAYALAIIMQLGIFNVFVGNLRIIDDMSASGMSVLPVSFEPEWASMLGAANTNLMSSPWTLIAPAVAFFISILGLNLFGEGLRKILQKRDSNFIPAIRRVLSIEKADLKWRNLNPVKGKFRVLSILVIVLVIYTGWNGISNMKYNLDSSKMTLTQTNQQVVIGTPEASQTASWLADQLKKFGYSPISDTYIIPYKNESSRFCDQGSLRVDGEAMQLNLGVDFTPVSFYDWTMKGTLMGTEELDLFSINEFHQFDNKIVLIDGDVYSIKAIVQIADKIMKNSKAVGIIAKTAAGESMPKQFGSDTTRYPFALVNAKISGQLKQGKLIQLAIKCKQLSDTGNNVIGMIKGSSTQTSKAIMLGFSYNYTSAQSAQGQAKLKLYLELAKQLAQKRSDRAIIISFWDGMISDKGNGAAYYSNHTIFETEKIDAYIDLTKLDTVAPHTVQFSSVLAPISRYFAWSLAHTLKTELQDRIQTMDYANIRSAREVADSQPNEDETMYYNGKVPVILIAAPDQATAEETKGNKTISMDQIGSVVFRAIENIKY